MRRALAAAIAVLALVVLPVQPVSAGDPVKDREAAQARANAAAAKFAKASSSLATIERELKELEGKTAATRTRLSGLEGEVKLVAINSYVRGNVNEAFFFEKDLGRTSRRKAMARFVTVGDADAVDEFRAARADLEAGSSAVRQQLEAKNSAAGDLRKQKTAAYAELSRLAVAEKAYLAKIAAEKAATEKAAAEKAAAEKAAAAKRVADAKLAAARAAASRVTPTPTTAKSTTATTKAPTTATTKAPTTAAEKPSGVIASGEWICPVQGPVSFSNDWGQPRSGGRSHQGTDMLNARGTPIVAPVSGTVRSQNSSLGGLSFFLSGDDGVTYFGTHMMSFAASGRVSAGTVVGYNGDSGNARGTNHLHFEIHPGGGAPINPYPTLSKYC